MLLLAASLHPEDYLAVLVQAECGLAADFSGESWLHVCITINDLPDDVGVLFDLLHIKVFDYNAWDAPIVDELNNQRFAVIGCCCD